MRTTLVGLGWRLLNGDSVDVFSIAKRPSWPMRARSSRSEYNSNLSKLKGVRDVQLPTQVIPSKPLSMMQSTYLTRQQSRNQVDWQRNWLHVTGKWSEARMDSGKPRWANSSQVPRFDLTFMTRSFVCTVTDHALFQHIPDTSSPIGGGLGTTLEDTRLYGRHPP